MSNKSEKGVALAAVLMGVAVLLVLASIFFSSLLSQKTSVDFQKYAMQSLALAEAGASQGRAELKKRVRVDIKGRIEDPAEHWTSATFSAYIAGNNSLGFLHDFGYAAGQPQFTVSGGNATLTLNAPDLNTAISGNYTATLLVQPNGAPTSPSADVYVFPYQYSVTSQGSVTATNPSVKENVRLWQGEFAITILRANFAKFALFTSHHTTPSGTTVWFTENTNFSGPVSTNGRFSFANNPSGHFTDAVTQHETKARFYNEGSSILMDADANGTTDVPIFDVGYERGYSLINLPSSVTQNDLKTQALGTMANPGSDGIYVPNSSGAVTGGILIKGDASVTMSVNASNNAVYAITQGSTTKNITVDRANSQTTVETVSGSTVTYTGVPDGVNDEGILIYSLDDITSFSGTVQKNSSVTVSAERDIVISNNVRYETYTASPLSGTDPATGLAADNMLGLIAWGGDVRIGTSAPHNVEIHGIIMAPHGVFTVDNYDGGSPRGTATLLGGVITDFYGAFGQFSGTTPLHGYGRNFVYDPRVLNGKTPPYFPYLSGFTAQDDFHLDDKMIWEGEGV
ncbi:MAG: DUF4900 domain-containing protein [Candidatus Omnitrophica bacterium]|nr:DUF4900 domain-containing protein [Candidatus Omnitrophota bacterium]MDD5573646.1 DUF4900 domain-containing protein [Candidatus Omnitrophota bacterium]